MIKLNRRQVKGNALVQQAFTLGIEPSCCSIIMQAYAPHVQVGVCQQTLLQKLC